MKRNGNVWKRTQESRALSLALANDAHARGTSSTRNDDLKPLWRWNDLRRNSNGRVSNVQCWLRFRVIHAIFSANGWLFKRWGAWQRCNCFDKLILFEFKHDEQKSSKTLFQTTCTRSNLKCRFWWKHFLTFENYDLK